ncbi:MAG: hypothetical protein ISR62_03870 [Desulfobacteraceae bacterium]|nr:hypothetical protein [Desulfobacteraceae bacterium]
MENSEMKCPRCGLEALRDDYRFCLKCGTDLGRNGIKVECCNRYIFDPWALKEGYVPVCPYCGEKTGQASPAVKAAEWAEVQSRWRDEEKQRKRALNPPKLFAVKIRAKRLAGLELAQAVAGDVVKELNSYDTRCVIVGEGTKETDELFKAFQGHAKRLATTVGQGIIDEPPDQKKADINDKFERGQPVFTTAEILPGLRLQYANRFFFCVPTVSDELLKTLGRLASTVNKSKGPVIFDYLGDAETGLASLTAHRARIKRYQAEEAIIEGGEG